VPNYRLQLETAIEAARVAGGMLREEFHREGGPRGEGGHADIDIIAEGEIHRILMKAFPSYGYRGEELGLKAVPRDAAHHSWVVDPNDGTSDFLRGFRGSSVAIALLRAGRPVLGVVYAYCAPDSAGDLIEWADGCGPVRRDGIPVQRAWPREVSESCTVLVSTYADFKVELNARAVAPMRFRGTPSIAYRLAMIAVGDADATVSLNAPNAWDYAAGHALLLGAGANLADGRGRPIAYSNDAHSDCAGACYGGAGALICDLMDRDWSGVKRGPRDRSTPFILPVRGRAIRDPGMLSRAQGCIIGQLASGAAPGSIEGQPSGASEMALALARSIVRAGRYDAGHAARAYAGLRHANGTEALSNGALLRVCPIGVAYQPAAAWVAALKDAALTHPDPLCHIASGLYAATISFAIRSGEDGEAVFDWAVKEAIERKVPDSVRHSLRDAFYPPSGALSGAVAGLRKLPQRSTDRVVTARPIVGLPGVEHPRPSECWATDALYIAERLATIEHP
jgi:ADP-ribosyl-[dinitrogen reductase] hydrolase